MVLVLAYSYRDDLTQNRLVAELIPGRVQVMADGTMEIRASAGGHFFVEASVNGEPVRFMIDTGASDIVLSPADARRCGFDPAQLEYDRNYETANGRGKGAPVVLRDMRVGKVRLSQVQASVNFAPMDASLLGMSFLHKLHGFSVEGDRFILIP